MKKKPFNNRDKWLNLLQPFYYHKFIDISLPGNKTNNFKLSKILVDPVLRKFILAVLNEIKNHPHTWSSRQKNNLEECIFKSFIYYYIKKLTSFNKQ